MNRRYAVKSAYNMRDLGGYHAMNGILTKAGRIFRSDCPTDIHHKDTSEVQMLNIQTVIDLRTDVEILKRPSYYAGVEGISYYNVPFLHGKDKPEVEAGVSAIYLKLMEDPIAIRKILTLIAQSPGNVLFHCAFGKDRTGIVSALILKICGVSNDEIIADYQVSETYLFPVFTAIMERHPEWTEYAGRSKPEYMRGCLTLLEEKYGSFEGYLKQMGFEEDLLEAVRERLLGYDQRFGYKVNPSK